MKLKEYWPSWRNANRLKGLHADTLLVKQPCSLPVVVSLTSIPSRLATLHITIRSLLAQTVPAQKIVLWLHHDLANALPLSLSSLQGDVFEIRYVELTCSHRKLIHALEAFPDQVIVTCDDDLMYAPTWLEDLYAEHTKEPQCIVANVCRQITRGPDGELLPYKEWSHLPYGQQPNLPLLPVGYGGVVYPPHSLDSRVQNIDLFMRLAPKADDLWFRAMAWLHNTSVLQVSTPPKKAIPIIGANKVSLLKTNVRQDGNRIQWQALCDYFGLQLQ